MESREAVVCLHCGYNTVTGPEGRARKVEDQTAGVWFLWLLPGILCVLGIIGLAVTDVLYCLYIEEWLDPESWYGATLSYGGIKLWNCIFSAGIMWLLAKFAVHRLIFDRVPPEVEKH